MNAAELFQRIERVCYAVQRTDPSTNPKVTCIQFRGDRIFSLDGRRMACDTLSNTVFPLPCLLSGNALVHLKAFGESEVTIQVDERAVCFSSGTLKLYARRYGADTYDPDTAIPKKYQEVITVRTDELIRELTYLKECAGVCAYQEKCDYLIKSSSQSPAVMDRWVLKVQALEEKKRHYEGVLQRELSGLDDEFSVLKLLSQELQVRANSIRSQRFQQRAA